MNKSIAYITLVVTAAFAVAPIITPPFSGFTADQLPIPQIDPPVQPAGYAFAIWGIIYAWLVVSAVFGVIKRSDAADWQDARLPLIVSLGFGVPWLWIAGQSAIWATIVIFLMAIGAILALINAPQRDRLWLQAPVGLYAGWLTAASFVSLGSTMAGYGVLTDQLGWAYIGIIGALAVAVAVYLRRPSPGYALAVIWALAGIIVANGLTSVGFLAGFGILIMVGLAVRRRLNDRQYSS